jgi:hypothetical protein
MCWVHFSTVYGSIYGTKCGTSSSTSSFRDRAFKYNGIEIQHTTDQLFGYRRTETGLYNSVIRCFELEVMDREYTGCSERPTK